MRWVPALRGQGGRVPRAGVAAALLTFTAGGALVDALVGGRLTATPVVALAVAGAGLLAGAWLPPAAAVLGCGAATAVLTAANQLSDPGAYSVPNDLFFFAVLVGGTALVGAVLAARRRQLLELRRLSAIRQQQRETEVRAIRLEERNRLATGVVESLVQRLGALVVQSSGVSRDPVGPAGLDALARMEGTARDALSELRDVVGTLREPDPPSTVEDPATVEKQVPFGWADVLAGCSGLPLAFESVASSAAHGPAWANVIAGTAVGLPLAVRRQRPVTAVVAMVVVATLMSAWLTPLPITVSVLLPLSLAAYSIGSCAHGRARGAGLLVLVVGMGATVLVSPPGSADVAGVAPTALWLGLAFLAGVVADQHARRAQELHVLLRDIDAGQRHALRLAVAEQRIRTARELHDSVAHAMTVVCLQAQAAIQHPGDEDIRRSCVATIEATARGAMVELGSEPFRDVPSRELAEGFLAMAGSLGVSAAVQLEPEDLVVTGSTAHVVRQLVREALVNVARHAPRAQVRVRCVATVDGLDVEVADDGRAAPDLEAGTGHGTSTGLRGLAEMVGTVGGRFEFGSTTSGFRVAAHLPAPAGVPA